jgi:hypothetical protein
MTATMSDIGLVLAGMVRPSLFNAIHNLLGVGVTAGKAKYPMRSSTTLATRCCP